MQDHLTIKDHFSRTLGFYFCFKVNAWKKNVKGGLNDFKNTHFFKFVLYLNQYSDSIEILQ